MTVSSCVRWELDLHDSPGRRLTPDALVVQEDRNLVLSSPPVLDLDESDSLASAYLALAAFRPVPLGRYLVLRPSEQRPYWMYQAVVHDLDQRPSARPGDVQRALLAVAADAARRGLQSLALEPLGLLGSGGLSLEAMAAAFDEVVRQLMVGLERSLRITLLLEDLAQMEEVSRLLRARVMQSASRSLRSVSEGAAVVEANQGDVRLQFRFVPGSPSGYLVSRSSRVA